MSPVNGGSAVCPLASVVHPTGSPVTIRTPSIPSLSSTSQSSLYVVASSSSRPRAFAVGARTLPQRRIWPGRRPGVGMVAALQSSSDRFSVAKRVVGSVFSRFEVCYPGPECPVFRGMAATCIPPFDHARFERRHGVRELNDGGIKSRRSLSSFTDVPVSVSASWRR